MSFNCLCPEDELGSGGKILRSRRFAVSASSPFVRPKSPPSSESPGFLTALFTGAGKLLSSVFVVSSSPSPSSSSLSSSASDICIASDDNGCENDDDAYNGDDDQVSDIHFKEAELSQTVRRKKVDATQQELHDSTGRNSIASPGDWCSLSQTRRSPGAFPCSAHSLRVLTPDTLLSQAHFPVLSHVSIEAKKRFEEKLESRSNLDWDHGPCTLNTAMLPNVTEDEVCSPIDMDKFYTEARRPWASPSSSSIGFKTPLRMHLTMMKHHVQMHAVISLHPSSSLGLKSPGFIDRISWKSTGFSHCEFAAARPTEACQLLTEMSIDFPTTPKINGRNCADGPEIDATSDLGWLL